MQWQPGETKEDLEARQASPDERELHRQWLVQYNISRQALRLQREKQELAGYRAAQKEMEKNHAFEIKREAWRREHPWRAFVNRHGADRIFAACFLIAPILILLLLHLRWK